MSGIGFKLSSEFEVTYTAHTGMLCDSAQGFPALVHRELGKAERESTLRCAKWADLRKEDREKLISLIVERF